MSNPFNVLKPWKPGDTREVPERKLKQVRLEGKYDSYSQTYDLDGRFEIQDSLPSGTSTHSFAVTSEGSGHES